MHSETKIEVEIRNIDDVAIKIRSSSIYHGKQVTALDDLIHSPNS